jgi:hypothetical protein
MLAQGGLKHADGFTFYCGLTSAMCVAIHH